jgi:hypothetical protein
LAVNAHDAYPENRDVSPGSWSEAADTGVLTDRLGVMTTNVGDQGRGWFRCGEHAAGRGASGAARDGVQQDHLRALSAVRAELTRSQEPLCAEHHPVSDVPTRVSHAVANGTARTRDTAHHAHLPARLRVTRGENRWTVMKLH